MTVSLPVHSPTFCTSAVRRKFAEYNSDKLCKMRPRVKMPVQNGVEDTLVTFVASETEGNVHVFLSDTLEMGLVETIAMNFRYVTV